MMRYKSIIHSWRLQEENKHSLPVKVDQYEVSPPITVEDIDKAPITLPQDSSADWQERYNLLSDKFSEVADENFYLKEQNYQLRSKGKTDGILDKLIVPASVFVLLIIIAILIVFLRRVPPCELRSYP